MTNSMEQSLRRLASALVRAKAVRAALEVEGLACCAMAAEPSILRWLRKRYERLRDLHRRRRATTSTSDEEAYTDAAKEHLDDVLRQREAGPPGERLYVWFCRREPSSCAPCRARHGRIRTLGQWRAEGMPGPGVCLKPECGCALFPMRPGGQPPAGAMMADDGSIAALVGLREDNTAHNMQQGFALMPFWSNSGGVF